jgi:hypothetical protein
MTAKPRPGDKDESIDVAVGPTTDGQITPDYDPELLNQLVNTALALEEQQKLNELGLQILIARRNALEERRDQLNGKKSKFKPSPKTGERQQKIEEKVRAILRDDPDAKEKAIWRKVYNDQRIRKLAKSHNTLENDFRIALQKQFIGPPLGGVRAILRAASDRGSSGPCAAPSDISTARQK